MSARSFYLTAMSRRSTTHAVPRDFSRVTLCGLEDTELHLYGASDLPTCKRCLAKLVTA